MQLIPHRDHFLTKFALGSLSPLINCLRLTESLTDTIRIGEVGLEGCRFTLSTLNNSLIALRQFSEKPIEIYKLDLAANNINYMTELLSTDPDSYATIPNVHTYFASGPFPDRVFAPNSLNVLFISHILSVVAVRDPAPDTIFTSLSENTEFMKRRRKYASDDFVFSLEKRHEELIKGGMVCFDVMGKPIGSPNIYELLAETVRTAYERNIVPAEHRKINMIAHFRSEEELANDIERLRDKFRLVSIERKEIVMPQYTEYLADNNKQKYAEQLTRFWHKAIGFELTKHLDHNQIDEALKHILNVYEEKVLEQPPSAVTESHSFILEKIN